MDIKKLVEGIKGCSCGMDHLCPVDYIEIGDGVLSKLPAACQGYHNILLVADQNTYRVCGKEVEQVLGDAITAKMLFDTGDDVLIPDERAVEATQEKITSATDLIIGVGSGVINDLCKYVSFKNDLPYYIVATAPSMDGYVSVGAAMILEGMKETVSARPPKALFAESKVLAEAPMRMLQAGYGDIVGKYSCLNDWELATLLNGEYFCQKVYDLTMDTVQKVEPLAEGILKRDHQAVGALMEALVVVGVAMAYVGNSRPASGSEHHLSHYFEITGIVYDTPYLPHGIDVVYSAVVTAALRERVVKGQAKAVPFDEAEWEKNIRRVYGSSADGVLKLQRKLNWYNDHNGEAVFAKEEQVKALLAKAPTEQQMLAIVKKIGLDMQEFYDLYGTQKVEDAILYAKDLKDRYSVLWTYNQFFRG
ncbi:MAG: sn-glycerol-1-phosphate dehydrogenase [Clostridia bacterium]|nr:sn-glycerol-1-phosphate dehydrogenase [Clostridia bacterium]